MRSRRIHRTFVAPASSHASSASVGTRLTGSDARRRRRVDCRGGKVARGFIPANHVPSEAELAWLEAGATNVRWILLDRMRLRYGQCRNPLPWPAAAFALLNGQSENLDMLATIAFEHTPTA